MSYLLTDEEKSRFCRWLEKQVESAEQMERQLEKFGPAGEMVAKKMSAERLAATVVLRMIRSGETVSVGNEEAKEKR